MFNFKDKKALVTGGLRGIGRAITLMLAEGKADIAIIDIGGEDLEESLREELSKFKSRLLVKRADVSNNQQVKTAVDEILQEFNGQLDILVNNAGITRDNLLLRMSEDEWDKVIAVNLKGVFNCTQACLRTMVKQKSGVIVNVASIVGIKGNAGQTNYSASKAGVVGFTKSLAKEVGSRGIRVNAVAPGFIETDMTRSLPDEVRSKVLPLIPLGRFGQVEEVASVVVWLASDFSSYLTGEVISIDGGLML